MPFDFKKYDAKCASLDPDALQREWEHYTRLISGAATSTAVSGMAIPFTLGVSTIGVGLAAPAIHNARKKREIIERHLQRHGRTHHTRKRDVITSSAISGTVGVVTLGLAPVGADAICNSAAEHGIAYIAENELGVKIATHLALDAVAVAAEETHMHSKKEQEAWKAYAQGVQEGKNPPLPTSDLKIPVTTSPPTGDSQVNYQYASFQAAPSINVVPTWEQKSFVEAAPVYYPPPPGQAGLKVDSPLHRRHSTSTLSSDIHKTSSEPLQPQSGGQLMYGTATAISAPIVGGQSYYIQPPWQSTSLPSRPSFAIGGGYLPAESLKAQQDQMWTQPQRPRAHSTVSFDSPPSYETHQQNQLLYGSSQLSPPSSQPPHLLPPPQPSSPYLHPPSSPQPQYSQTTSSNNQQTWAAPYNPNDYTHPHPQQQQQPQNFHAPPQLIYSSQDTKHQIGNQKGPFVYQYEVPSPGSVMSPQYTSMSTPTGALTHYSSPDQPPYNSYFREKGSSQQIPYFPPPPTAY